MNRGSYIIPEMVLMLLTCLSYLAASIFVVANRICERYDRCERCVCLKKKYYHLLLRRAFKVLKKGPQDTEDEPETMLHSRQVPEFYITMLTFYTIFFLALASIVFLDVFLIEITDSCDPGARVDCFLVNATFSVNDEPIDCNNVSNLERQNVTFVCYEYVLSIGKAAGVAGGLFTLPTSILSGITFVLLSLNDMGGFYTVMAYALIIIVYLVASAVVLVLTLQPNLFQIVFEGSLSTILQFYFVLLMIIAVLAIPLWRFNAKHNKQDV